MIVKRDGAAFLTLCEHLLERGYDVRFRAEGTSMLPTIRHGDRLTVSPVDRDAIEAGEIVLYRCHGRPIAHRVAEVRTGADGGVEMVVARGDGKAGADAPVPARSIVGKVVSIERRTIASTLGLRANVAGLVREGLLSLRQSAGLIGLLARSVAVCAFVFGAAVTAEAQMITGSYTGNGVDNRAITELGFQPDVIIVKGDTAQIGVIRTSTMVGDLAKPMTGATALAANLIQSLDTSGFTIGTDARVNSNGIEYYWAAFKANPGKMKLGTYTGNGAAGRSVTGVGFPGDIVFVMSAGGANAIAATSLSLPNGATGLNFLTTVAGGWFQSFDGDGFTLGTSTTANNANGVTYHYVMWNEVEGQVNQSGYSGDGTDNRNITGVGFEPEYVITFSGNGQDAVQHTASIGQSVDDSMFFSAAAGLGNRIQALQADGFQVGSNVDVNENTQGHIYIAWARIQGPPQMISGTYTGNATDNRAITGLGFRPDFVLVKAATAQNGVFRSSRMNLDSSKPATGPTAQTANLVQTLDEDGFTIGNSADVNGSGVTYYWVAFSAGAGEMVVNNYTGNGADNRSITGLGFQPEYVIVMPEGAAEAVHRSSSMAGDMSFEFDNSTSAANLIQALQADGFQVGTDARVNTNGATYQYVAWNQIAGKMAVGSYAGNNVDNRSITGVGFQPEYVIVRPSSANSTVQHSNAMGASTDVTQRFYAIAGLANSIQALEANGFQVGTDATANVTGNTNYWMAWKRPVLTAVRMGDMDAVRTAAGVSIAWRTGYEVDNLGFHVYREIGGERTKVTSKLVAGSALSVSPGLAMPAGNSYTWKDDSPLALETGVQYWIEDVDLNGQRTLHGPVVPVTAKAPEKVDGANAATASGGSNVVRRTATPAPNSRLLEELTAVRPAPGGAQAAAPLRSVPLAERVTPSPRETATSNFSSDPQPAPAEISERVSAAPERPKAQSPIRIAASQPVQASAPASLRTSAALDEIVSGSPRPGPSAALLAQWTIASQYGPRISVRTAGWYRLTRAELLSAGISPTIDPRNLRLFVDGVERPMIVTGQSDGTLDPADVVEFYGTGADTPFTDAKEYWIVAGQVAGLRLPAVDARTSGAPAGASFAHTVERKDREVFFAALLNGEAENFFGPTIMDGAVTTQVLTLPHVADPPAADAQLVVSLQGVTALEAADDHRVGVAVNGVGVGEMVFDGRTTAVAAFPVPHVLLTTGDNTVTLEARGGVDDVSLVESVRLTYEHAYLADGDRLTLTADAGQQLTITGFSSADIRVFDVTGDIAAQELLGTVVADGPAWSIDFTVPAGTPRKLFVATSNAVSTPAAQHTNLPSTLNRQAQAGDIVMITDPSLASALTPLRNLRQTQGYTVQVVDVQDIYDEFAYGQKTPVAIRDFLTRASESWSKPPRFVLLVGNATTDPRNYLGLGEPDLVPTKIVPTDALETASDDWFADADGDGFADLAAVGRLPGRTAAEVTIMVDKIVGYEQSSPEAWHRTVLLVSDDGLDDLGEGDPEVFAASNAAVGALVPPDYQVSHLRRDQDPSPAQTLRTRLSDGALILNYLGHGSVDVWRGNLLTATDAATLANGSRLPLVVAMTCFTGFFHGLFPEESLAEALLRAPGGGAVGVWASSGLTDTTWQASMDRELFRQIFEGNWTSVGEALRAAKKVVGNRDVRRTWIFFGDPALRLKGLSHQPMESVTTVTSVSAPPPPATAQDALEGNDGIHRRPAHVTVRLANFDGDALDDALLALPDTGSWMSAIGAPGSFRETLGQFGIPGEPLALRLNDDTYSDVFVYNTETGQWLQGMSMGDGRFLTSTGAWAAGMEVVSGDLNGDGRDDLFGHHPDGTWMQALSDGAGDFQIQSGSGLPGGHAYVADFDADGRGDVFAYNAVTGQWTMAFSRGSSPPVMTSGTWSAGWQPVVARLNGDSAADLVLWHADSGGWVQCFRDPSQFFIYRTGTWTPGGRVQPMDLNGDGHDELLRYDWRSGEWTFGTLASDGAMQESNGLWEVGWEVTPGDLNGDGRQDLLLYNPDTGQWLRRLNLPVGWVDEASGLWPRDWTVAGRRR